MCSIWMQIVQGFGYTLTKIPLSTKLLLTNRRESQEITLTITFSHFKFYRSKCSENSNHMWLYERNNLLLYPSL